LLNSIDLFLNYIFYRLQRARKPLRETMVKNKPQITYDNNCIVFVKEILKAF